MGTGWIDARRQRGVTCAFGPHFMTSDSPIARFFVYASTHVLAAALILRQVYRTGSGWILPDGTGGRAIRGQRVKAIFPQRIIPEDKLRKNQ